MKKSITLIIALMMVFVLFAGCAGNADDPETSGDEVAPSEETVPSEDPVPSESPEPLESPEPSEGPGSTFADFSTDFYNAKFNMISRLTQALSQNPDFEWASIMVPNEALMIEAVLTPISCFGQGEEEADNILSTTNVEAVDYHLPAKTVEGWEYAGDLQYSENGNTYTISFSDPEGSTLEFSGVFDPVSDSLVVTYTKDGVKIIYSEYHKTSFGYVSQHYYVYDDGSARLYLVSISGDDGAVGVSDVTAKPAEMTGGEPADFPSASDEWYAINGNTVTGVTSDGTAINFEYVP